MKRFPLVLLLALAVGCEEARDEDEILGPAIAVADKEWDGFLLEFGSPLALPRLGEEGWSHGETADDGNTFRWAVEEEVSLTLPSDRDGARLAFLECEPFQYDGSPTQWIAVSLNGEALTEVELRPGRDRYPIELPLAAGDNHLDLRFRYAGDPNRTSADRRRLAVKFFRLFILPDDEAPVRGRPGPFSRVADGVLVPAGGALTLYAAAQESARLRVDPGEGNGTLRLTVRTEDETLVDETVEASWERELRLDAPVAIELRVDGGDRVVSPELHVPAAESPPAVSAPADKNVVLVFLDGANALRMGPYGHEGATPHIDALGRQGIVFENAVSQAVYTIASVGSMLTGQYPERHQIVSFSDKLSETVPTLPGVLAAHGYETVGFAGNRVASAQFGLDRGYERYVQVWDRDDYTGRGDSVVAAVREWLDEPRRAERFFAYVHFREPHFPYDPPAPFDTRFGDASVFPDGIATMDVVDGINDALARGHAPEPDVKKRIQALYDGNLAYVDELVGELLRCLDERGLTDDTIVILSADHGEAIFEHGYVGHNTQLYEESIRVPLIVRIPGREPGREPGLAELIDLAPTVLALAGAEVPEGMQGRDLLAAPARAVAFSRTLWKRPRYAARSDEHKLIWDSRTGDVELYDLGSDPEETRDVHEELELTAGRLRQTLLVWLREQEHLRAGVVPDQAVLSEEERRRIGAGGYTDFLPNKK